MIQVKSPDDIYPALEELIKLLKQSLTSNLSAVLDHRLHKVAWTTEDELLEELRSVLSKARCGEAFEADILIQIDQVVSAISEKLRR